MEPGTGAIVAGSAVASFIVVALVRMFGSRRLVDTPNSRSSHTRPTPRGGGIGIVLSVIVGGLLLYGTAIAPYLALALLIAGVSFLDDLFSIPALLRFAVHGAGAAGVMILAGHWSQLAFPPHVSISFGAGGVVITFLWIVGLTNAYNFMDGIDGIAGLQAIIASAGWIAIIAAPPKSQWGVFAMLLGATTLGFLIHNWPPAAIFMGDVGSAFLGFSFAMIGVVQGTRQPALMVCALLMVWPFVFDATLTFVRRLMRREPVFKAHRTHLYQRLVITGLKHRTVTLIYGAFASATALCAFALARSVAGAILWVPLSVAAMSAGLVGFTFVRERAPR